MLFTGEIFSITGRNPSDRAFVELVNGIGIFVDTSGDQRQKSVVPQYSSETTKFEMISPEVKNVVDTDRPIKHIGIRHTCAWHSRS